jgi:hypothetical protein
MSKWLKSLEGPNGAGFDTARILFLLGGLSGIIYQGVALYKGQSWDPAAFLGGFGAYVGGGGLGISLKDKGVASALNTTPPSPPIGGQP